MPHIEGEETTYEVFLTGHELLVMMLSVPGKFEMQYQEDREFVSPLNYPDR